MKTFILILPVLAAGANALPMIRTKKDNAQTSIVGGRPADQGEIPYQLGLQNLGEPHCGASLIEVQGVFLGLSASHCVPKGIPEESFTLIAGDLDLSESSGIEQVRQVTKIVRHEGFDPDTYENDIALLFIDEPFKLNENVMTIALPEAGADTNGELSVSGWEKLSYQGSIPDRLQIVIVPVVDDATCEAAYENLGNTIVDHFICAGYLGVGGMDACQGYSGGPARSLDGNYLAGIVSWGEGCAEPSYPGVYTEVSFFIDWINDNVAAHVSAVNKTISQTKRSNQQNLGSSHFFSRSSSSNISYFVFAVEVAVSVFTISFLQ